MNKYLVQDLFNFITEIADPDSSNSMHVLDTDSFLLTSHLKKPSKQALIIFLKNDDIVHGLKKSELKDLLSLITNELYFTFNKILHKQTDRVPMGSPLGPLLAFFTYHEQN